MATLGGAQGPISEGAHECMFFLLGSCLFWVETKIKKAQKEIQEEETHTHAKTSDRLQRCLFLYSSSSSDRSPAALPYQRYRDRRLPPYGLPSHQSLPAAALPLPAPDRRGPTALLSWYAYTNIHLCRALRT